MSKDGELVPQSHLHAFHIHGFAQSPFPLALAMEEVCVRAADGDLLWRYALSPWAAFKACLRREWILMQRHAFLYVFRTAQVGQASHRPQFGFQAVWSVRLHLMKNCLMQCSCPLRSPGQLRTDLQSGGLTAYPKNSNLNLSLGLPATHTHFLSPPPPPQPPPPHSQQYLSRPTGRPVP